MSESKTLKAVMLDVGALKKREIKQLKVGAGPVLDQVRSAAGKAVAAPDTAVLIVIAYEKRPKKPRGLLGGLLRKR